MIVRLDIFDYLLFLLELQIDGTCADTYDNLTSSFIVSPNYPQDYGSYVDCRWLITISTDKSIVLNFTEFMTESYRGTLYIFEGENLQGKRLYQLDGSSPPSEKLITSDSVYLYFRSYNYDIHQGFKIMLSTTGKSIKYFMRTDIYYNLELVTTFYLYLMFYVS